MQVDLAPRYRLTALGNDAQALLAPCVQCGQCTFICPTFRLLDDEWDGPRGRIFLIKQMLEDRMPSPAALSPAYSFKTLRWPTIGANLQERLDRCLTCRSCESKCPQNVRYGRLLDLARELTEQEIARPLSDRLLRRTIRAIVPYRRRFTAILRLGQAVRGVLPQRIRHRIPERRRAGDWPTRLHSRTMIIWQGCVQPALAPDINAAAARVLDRLGIQAIPASDGCCGAISQHLAAPEEARDFMRRNIDTLWPHVLAGAEAIVLTASGCGAHFRDYGMLLEDDPLYAVKAKRISELTKDISEVVSEAWPKAPQQRVTTNAPHRIAFLSSCSLQHTEKLNHLVDRLLRGLNFRLMPVQHPFMCCGAAGTYSILQRGISTSLREYKLQTLLAPRPQLIVTANIGCLAHMAPLSPIPVHHWIELLDHVLPPAPSESPAYNCSRSPNA